MSNWQIIWYDGTTKQSSDLPLVNHALYGGTSATTINIVYRNYKLSDDEISVIESVV